MEKQRRIAERIADERDSAALHNTGGGQKAAQRERIQIEIAAQCGIRREQHLKAVIAHQTVTVRAAHAPANGRFRLEHQHGATGAMQLNGTHQAGHAGANHDDRGSIARHTREKWRVYALNSIPSCTKGSES